MSSNARSGRTWKVDSSPATLSKFLSPPKSRPVSSSVGTSKSRKKEHEITRYRAILVESVRVDGKPRQRYIEFIASYSPERMKSDPLTMRRHSGCSPHSRLTTCARASLNMPAIAALSISEERHHLRVVGSQTIGERPTHRQLSKAVLTATTFLTVIISSYPIAVEAKQDSYCLQGRQWGYPGNCQFSTYPQCMAAASGTDAYCGVNPQKAYARQRRGGWTH